MAEEFVTRFGRRLPILDDYRFAHVLKKPVLNTRQALPAIRQRVQMDAKKSKWQRALGKVRREGLSAFADAINRRFHFYPKIGLLKDYVEYSVVTSFMDEVFGQREWKRSLDIGSQTGYIPQLFHVDGRVDEPELVDVEDAFIPLNMSDIRTLVDFVKVGLKRYNSDVSRTLRQFAADAPAKQRLDKLRHGRAPYAAHRYVDDFIVLPNEHSHDLITAFLCAEYFDPVEFFASVAGRLVEGGCFVMLVNYWFWPVNSTLIVGHFPYAAQRLDEEDFFRYVNTYLEDESEDVLRSYKYFHKGIHPTVGNYVDLALVNDLHLVSYKRLMPSRDGAPKTPLYPKLLESLSDFGLGEVLEDISHFRDDVRYEDLKTAFVLAVFERRSNTTRTLAQAVDELPAGT